MLKRILVTILFSFAQLVTAAVPPTSQYKVIIIGAGVAGLEAARYLQEHGIDNYIILEARDRIGGRVNTITPWKNVRLELGAEMIQGADAVNPIMTLVNKWNLHTVAVDNESSSFYNWNGIEVSDESEHFYTKLYEDFEKLLSQKRDAPEKNANLSLSDVAVELITNSHLDKFAQHGLLYGIADRIEQEYAADIRDLSALWYDNDQDMPGENKILIKGYQAIVDAIAQNLKSHIRLKQVVTNVNYENNQAIVVTTADGSQFRGEYVICTLPLGVLKSGKVTFQPPLPQEKIVAMSHLNMGIRNKIFMLFPKVFWDTEQFISYVPPAYWSGTNWVYKDKWIEFDNLNYFFQQPILTAVAAGDFAKETENKTDSEVIQSIMRILRIIYGDKIPEPTSYIITRWGKDPFSMGSYSSIRPGALDDGEDYLIMAKTVAGHLLFAGEATTTIYPSTVPGAYMSGDRVAKEILNHTEN